MSQQQVCASGAQHVMACAGWPCGTSSLVSLSHGHAHLALLQRCNDLLEVCEAQLQFAPRTPLPVFGGTKGPEVSTWEGMACAAVCRLLQAAR
jgi:hypothetical protein